MPLALPVLSGNGGAVDAPGGLGYSAAGLSFPPVAGMQAGFGVPSPALRQGANPDVCARIGTAVGISRCLAIFAPSKGAGRTLFLTGTLATTGVGARRVNAAGLGVASAGSFATDDGQVRNGRYGRHGGRLFRARRSAIDPKRPDGLSAVPDRAPVKKRDIAGSADSSVPPAQAVPSGDHGRSVQTRAFWPKPGLPTKSRAGSAIHCGDLSLSGALGWPPAGPDLYGTCKTGAGHEIPARLVSSQAFCRLPWPRARSAGWCRVCVVDDTCRVGRAMASRRGIEPLFPG